jgi:hypothetical protein
MPKFTAYALVIAVSTASVSMPPLVGMSLLEGYELNIQALTGGLVTIKILSST